MNLTYYRNFVEIVECGTISAASRKLLIAQPALSAQLKSMERELGAELLERTARQVVPTDAGRILYEKAKNMLMLQDVVEKEIAACVRGSRGDPCGLGCRRLCPMRCSRRCLPTFITSILKWPLSCLKPIPTRWWK